MLTVWLASYLGGQLQNCTKAEGQGIDRDLSDPCTLFGCYVESPVNLARLILLGCYALLFSFAVPFLVLGLACSGTAYDQPRGAGGKMLDVFHLASVLFIGCWVFGLIGIIWKSRSLLISSPLFLAWTTAYAALIAVIASNTIKYGILVIPGGTRVLMGDYVCGIVWKGLCSYCRGPQVI